MALYPITPPAGIIKNGTDYANTGRWVDGDLVRFENGYLKPIGGWREFSRNTPLNYLANNTGTVATTSGSATITVTTATAHGASAGDKVLLSGFASTGGISDDAINQNFVIVSAPTTTTFTVTTSETATSTATSSSANVYFPDLPIAMYTYRRNNGDKILAIGTRRGVLY